MPTVIIGMWSSGVGCNLGRELDHMLPYGAALLHQRLKHSDVSAVIEPGRHLLPIDEASDGIWLIAHCHIAGQPDTQTTLSHVVILIAHSLVHGASNC